MRILIYVEPHPIRNQPTHFNMVARRFVQLAAAGKGADVRIFGNTATLDIIAKAHPEETKGRLLRPLASEHRLFRSFEGDWNGERVEAWRGLMAGEGIAARYRQVIESVWSRFPFDAIVYWGENGAVRAFAADMGITAIAMELGFTRPPYFDSIVMDPFGTSGGSLIARMTAAELEEAVDGVGMSATEALFSGTDGRTEAFESGFAALPARVRDSVLGRRRKVALFPLQLADDANILRHSPYASQVEAVAHVIPRLAEAGYVTIVKEHPASRQRPQTMTDNAAARSAVRGYADGVLWIGAEETGYDNAQLLALADLVVTVNSSMGFEALHHDRTVVVLGGAAYKPADVFPDLDVAVAGDFDRAAYRRAIGHLRRFCLDAYLLPAGFCADASAFVDRVALLTSLSREGAGAAEVAKVLFAAASRARAPRRFATLLDGPWRGVAGASLARPEGRASAADAPGKIPGLLDAGLARDILRALWRISGATGTRGLDAWLVEVWSTPGERARTLSRLGLFDPEHYLARYPDVGKAGLDPLTHFVMTGEPEARSPRADIELARYHADRNTPTDGRLMLALLREIVSGTDVWPRAPGVAAGLVRPVEGVGEHAPVEEIVRRTRLIARRADRDGLLAWLDDGPAADPARWREVVARSRLFDAAHYARRNVDVAEAGIDVVDHFISYGQWEGRQPSPHIALEPPEGAAQRDRQPAARMLRSIVEASEWSDEEFILPLDAEEEALLAETREALAALSARPRRRIAVVAHCFYADIVPEILAAAGAIEEPCDLVVTLPAWGSRRVREAILAARPDAILCQVPNRGRDIAPFLTVLPVLVERDYLAVLKIHSKKGFRSQRPHDPTLGDAWRRHAFDTLAGTPAVARTVIDAFAAAPDLALAGPARLLFAIRDYPAAGMPPWYWHLFGIAGPEVGHLFFAGSMFWVRPSAIRQLVTPGLETDAFRPDDGASNGTLAHEVERIFSSVVLDRGSRIASLERDGDDVRLLHDPAPVRADLKDEIARIANAGAALEGALLW